MRGGEFVHDTNGIFVAGVGELTAVEHTDDGDVVALNAAVDGQSVIGAGFLFRRSGCACCPDTSGCLVGSTSG